jgi:hypothetical protein
VRRLLRIPPGLEGVAAGTAERRLALLVLRSTPEAEAGVIVDAVFPPPAVFGLESDRAGVRDDVVEVGDFAAVELAPALAPDDRRVRVVGEVATGTADLVALVLVLVVVALLAAGNLVAVVLVGDLLAAGNL